MKIRTGFVSNSSSSSFCILANGSSIFEIAQEMVLNRGWTRKQLDEWNSIGFSRSLVAFNNRFDDETLFNVLEEDKKTIITDGIAFPTCNFDTYIRQFGDKFVIQTCNNHPWHELDWKTVYWEKWPIKLKEEAIELYKIIYPNSEVHLFELAEFAEFHLSATGKYWYPVHRVFGRSPSKRTKRACRKDVPHYVDEIELDSGEIICPLCINWEGWIDQ